ncbi:PIN domain nuclease [Rathayibacter sp. VKM Ac-2759]|nr:PIN domain nuclease [Rathayibacter sp. VKM Ac-2759]
MLVDTDVFSHLFIRSPSAATDLDAQWRLTLRGRRAIISFQTRTEVLQGAVAAGWGQTRYVRVRSILDETPTIGVDNAVIDAHAQLFAECRRSGHPLQSKLHTGDRWVAACAIPKDVPILAVDRIYQNAPRLELATNWSTTNDV